MPIVNIESFLKDLGLEKIISQKIFSAGAPRAQGNSHTDEFDRILKEVTGIVNSLEASTVDDKDKISGELVDIIQLTRRVVYSAIREAENNKAGTAEVENNKKEENIAKAQEDFDKAFKEKLQDYLLEATVANIVNRAYMEFKINRSIAGKKIAPINSVLMSIFVDNVRRKTFFNSSFNSGVWINKLLASIKDKNHQGNKQYVRDICNYVVPEIKNSCLSDGTDLKLHRRFCTAIFDSAPDVTSKQILSLGGSPEIKKGVLVSFLRIILYPLTFVVDYLDKKRTYGLNELRLFKDGKEKPRTKEEAEAVKQKRLLDYKSRADPKLELQEVELDKDKLGKQQYAVLDCFEGDKPPNGTVIVFHGKNADIHTKPLIDNYRSIGEGYRVIMMEYPGFESSDGLLSKENISKVTYQLFEDAKRKDLIKGDVTVMGEDFGCYYAALLAKKIDEKEHGSCKGLMLSGQFIDNTSDLSKFGKIASYISDAEHLDTGSVLRSLPSTIPISFLTPYQDSVLNSIYPKKEEGKKVPLPYYCAANSKTLPVLNYEATDTDISKTQVKLNKTKKMGLRFLRKNIKSDEAFVYGKKPFSAFLSASASKVDDQKEQGAAK